MQRSFVSFLKWWGGGAEKVLTPGTITENKVIKVKAEEKFEQQMCHNNDKGNEGDHFDDGKNKRQEPEKDFAQNKNGQEERNDQDTDFQRRYPVIRRFG
ncbi:hypothetical protein [Acididesulfobacillus acetoxydans]|uniref:hypothetical protein n=1 Tax=Acididesulfobacillus acetoxydans TaxID=1561005 RepID=UPI0021C0E240|nr:hypothetical protein [Acididesulfobacillus acetoxydans]